jgi:NAD(P)-dependent dehydrogenase (short-subunit alcohol dehydrogenase family)
LTVNNLSLKGKIALITGACGGIGREISRKFAAEGAEVYLCDIKDCSDFAEKINEESSAERARSLICDISSAEEVKDMFGQISSQNSQIDILINNAAVKGPAGPHNFPEMSFEGFKKTIDIDLSGAVYCIQNVLPKMLEQEWGRIIFTAAPLSSSGIPAPYLAGKLGFIALADKIREKYSHKNIHSFALILRHTDTPMIRRVLKSRGKDVEAGIKKLNEKSLTGKMIKPAEIAELYSYFAAAEHESIEDLALLADGGITYLR